MSTVWLFPGQGSQSVGMGKALCESSPAARSVFQRANEALGFDLTKLCFDGPESDLMLTANTQPAILTTSIAILEAMKEALPSLPLPAFAAGHSLGEYSALVAAGALAFEDAVRLVRLRGRAMQEAVPAGQGGMAAIMGADPEAVEQLCADAAQGEIVSPANFNGPGQIVIAGHAGAVERASALAADRKLKAIPLKVSAPFHCALMAPAANAVAEALETLAVHPLAFPIVSNVEAIPNADPSKVKDLLVRQVSSPVQWERTIAWLSQHGVDQGLEIGQGKVLSALVKRIAKVVKVVNVAEPSDVAKIADLFVGSGAQSATPAQ